MTQSEYEERRRQLDAQLRAEVELLYQAYLVRLRALDTMRLGGGLNAPLQLAPPALADLLPSPAASPAAAPARRRQGAWSVLEEVSEALDQLEDTFTRDDVCRVLGYEPKRATLFRVFQTLEEQGVLVVHRRGRGIYPTIYRRAERPET